MQSHAVAWAKAMRARLPGALALLLAAALLAGQAAAQPAMPPQGGIVFLGDSMTRMGDWPRLLGRAGIANHGVDGDRSQDVLRRLPGILAQRPAKIFLMVGINDLRGAAADSPQVKRLLANHERIVADIQAHTPRTELFILSVLPVSNSLSRLWWDNRAVVQVNQRLVALAREKGCAYLDLYALFADEHGHLPGRYTHDGLHLNQAGYERWSRAIAPYL